MKKIRANALFIGTLLTWLMTCASVSAQSDGVRARCSPALSHPITMSKSGLRVMTAPAVTMTSARSLRGDALTIPREIRPRNHYPHLDRTLGSSGGTSLKKLVLRMYWDDETSASVEAPLGDFFGLGLGDYFQFESIPLVVAPDKALNCFFPMPFRKRARITITNEGKEDVDSFYFNIDYQALNKDLPADTMYFHAQYRQATPAKGWTNQWESNDTPAVTAKKNLDGENNYVWLEASGQGHFVGVTMSILQNQDGWWGEGDDMFFVDGEKHPSINGTGSEDYFLGAWDFGEQPFSYALFGAPVKGAELAGSRSSVYRFHLDSPIPFTKSLTSDNRTWPCQSSLRQHLFGRLLVPERTPCRISSAAFG